jgi:tRNA threonylcarbamoyl adenosine modification protein YeaZ
MTVLAVDTAVRGRALCVVVADSGVVLAARTLDGRHLDRELPGALAALLGGGNSQPTAVAAVLGPGSYTGLRVGVATALGLAHARDLPLYGIDALEVVARAAPPDAEQVEAVADAGRGALYVALYRREGATLRCTEPPHRVELTKWQPHPGHLAASLDPLPGTLDCAHRAVEALAAAAAAATRRPPLPRAGLEPVYLGGSGSAAEGPRV